MAKPKKKTSVTIPPERVKTLPASASETAKERAFGAQGAKKRKAR